MKRLLIVAVAMVFTVGGVYAFSTNVPWFVDNDGPAGDGASGQAAYVGLHNNSSADVVITVQYFTANGVDLGPAEDNTANIVGNSTVSFRPGGNFDGTSESAAAAAVPDRPTVDGKLNGSIVISWTAGDELTVQGRELQQGSGQMSAFLLPPGG